MTAYVFHAYWALQSTENGHGRDTPPRLTVVVPSSVPLALPEASNEPCIVPLALSSGRPPEKEVLKVRSALIETGPGTVIGRSGDVPRMKQLAWTVNVRFVRPEPSPATSKPRAEPSELEPA
jgi:hypothetical protein